MDDDDWDLQAVVKGCGGATAAAATTNPRTFSFADQINSFDFLTDDDHDIGAGPFQGLQDAYRELCGDAPPPPPAPASFSGLAESVPHPARHGVTHVLKSAPPVVQIMNNNVRSQENMHLISYSNGIGSSHILQAQSNRQRRRKNQQMKVVRQMTQEQLSADSWAWRKYGQKPIKGSLYPRNYYRCSTSKGCTARKQVERSPNDPELFVVSYTGEHTHPRPTHRSSLAGSTRTKPSTSGVALTTNSSNNDNIELLSGDKGLSICSLTSPGFPPSTPATRAGNEDVQEMAEGEAEDDDEEDNILTIPNHNYDDDHDDMFKEFDDHSTGDGSLFPIPSPP